MCFLCTFCLPFPFISSSSQLLWNPVYSNTTSSVHEIRLGMHLYTHLLSSYSSYPQSVYSCAQGPHFHPQHFTQCPLLAPWALSAQNWLCVFSQMRREQMMLRLETASAVFVMALTRTNLKDNCHISKSRIGRWNLYFSVFIWNLKIYSNW